MSPVTARFRTSTQLMTPKPMPAAAKTAALIEEAPLAEEVETVDDCVEVDETEAVEADDEIIAEAAA